MHIIFGWKDASKRAPRLRKKGDIYYSESNFNLYWPPDELLNLYMFINFMRSPEAIILAGDAASKGADMREAPFDDTCEACSKRTTLPCALYQNPQAVVQPDLPYQKIVKATMWPYATSALGRLARLQVCDIARALLGFTETGAERRFYELYFDHVLYSNSEYESQPPNEWFAANILRKAYEKPKSLGRGVGEVGDERWITIVRADLQKTWGSPALIPQVVLNFVIPSDLPDDHPDKEFYESNEGRVDFVFFDKNGKHMVQIDGPYHYRSDEEYTRRLRRDRTMRKQGWHVHRFSNMEVMEAEDFGDFAWELFG